MSVLWVLLGSRFDVIRKVKGVSVMRALGCVRAVGLRTVLTVDAATLVLRVVGGCVPL